MFTFQLHGLLWLPHNPSLWENSWCPGSNQQPRQTNGRVSSIFFSYMNVFHFELFWFCQILLLAGRPRRIERDVHSNSVCLRPGRILPRNQGGLHPRLEMSSSFQSWEIQHPNHPKSYKSCISPKIIQNHSIRHILRDSSRNDVQSSVTGWRCCDRTGSSCMW